MQVGLKLLLGAVLNHLGPVLGHLGPVLGLSRAILGYLGHVLVILGICRASNVPPRGYLGQPGQSIPDSSEHFATFSDFWDPFWDLK